MDAERKRIAREIRGLKHALEKGDIESFCSQLEQYASMELLIAIREQKVVLRANTNIRASVIAVLGTIAQHILPKGNAEKYQLYLEFVHPWCAAHADVFKRFEIVARLLPRMNLKQLLFLADSSIEQLLADLKPTVPEGGETVADFERRLHDLNGLANDTAYAVLRAMNELSKRVLTEGGSRDSHFQNRRRFRKATQIAGELNALEWLFDNVTYGALDISALTFVDGCRVRFDYADPHLNLMRTLSTRRRLVLNLNRARASRFVREMLKQHEAKTLQDAVSHYSEAVGVDPEHVDFEQLYRDSANILVNIDAEDDLVIAASGPDHHAAKHYVAGATLWWFASAGAAVLRLLPAGQRRAFGAVPIPLDTIRQALFTGGGVRVEQSIESVTVALPTRSHFDLVRWPFVRDDKDIAYTAFSKNAGLWNTCIRESLIVGGKLGDAYGKCWEEFIAQSFTSSDWQIIGSGLKVRRNKKIVTDIDLLLKRQDLLIVLQIKALIGSGVTPYDHWRNRQTIEWGCRQAAAAAEVIRTNRSWLVSVAGRRVAEEIALVQPLVLTTVGHFDGWWFEGVPVIGEVGRKAITEGMKVTYTDSATREIKAVHDVVHREDLSTEKILWALNNPLELHIAPEGLQTSHDEICVGSLTVELPKFKLRDNVASYPVHPPTDAPRPEE